MRCPHARLEDLARFPGRRPRSRGHDGHRGSPFGLEQPGHAPAAQVVAEGTRDLLGGLLLLLPQKQQGHSLDHLYAATHDVAQGAADEGPGPKQLHAFAAALVRHEADRAHDKKDPAKQVDAAHSDLPGAKGMLVRDAQGEGIQECREDKGHGTEDEHPNRPCQHVLLPPSEEYVSDLLGMLPVQSSQQKDQRANEVEGLLPALTGELCLGATVGATSLVPGRIVPQWL
mmetsp:Transcript_103030/g.291261  ORF Transcript_103030/g.291261 Transcript_103030/m.291261 type:complete len:229 (+) Transcript_103030:502-1188(+)